jgi:hypothetical protein
VVELKRTSVVLKDEFEGSTEVFFDVSRVIGVLPRLPAQF